MEKRFRDPISNVGIFGLTGRLIKRSIITKNEIFFDEKLRYLEDETFSWRILSKIKSINSLGDIVSISKALIFGHIFKKCRFLARRIY